MDRVPVLSAEELQKLLGEYLPSFGHVTVREVRPTGLLLSAEPGGFELRPGDTISGPSIFAFADVGAYMTVSAFLGGTPQATLTSSSVSFLEAAPLGVLLAEVEAVWIGRRSAVLNARVTDEDGQPVATATLHFSFPARAGNRRPA